MENNEKIKEAFKKLDLWVGKKPKNSSKELSITIPSGDTCCFFYYKTESGFDNENELSLYLKGVADEEKLNNFSDLIEDIFKVYIKKDGYTKYLSDNELVDFKNKIKIKNNFSLDSFLKIFK
jgi:hypothetical protein